MEIVKYPEYKQSGKLQATLGPDKESLIVVVYLYNRETGALEVAETGVWKKADLEKQRANIQAQLTALDAVLAEFPLKAAR